MKYRLDEVFELQMGKTPSRSNRDYWEPGKHKWLAISDFSNNRKYTSLTKGMISDLAVAETGITIIPANTVVMSFKLSIGKVAITSEPIYSNEAIMAFIDKGVCGIIPEYIYYYLKGLDWNRFGNKAVMGLTLNKKTLSSIEIDIPSVEEQRIVVEKLSRIESLFDGLSKQLDLMDNLVKSRFVELFFGKGFPVMKWRDVFSTTTGKLDSNAMEENGLYPFFTCAKEPYRINTYAFNQKALLLAGNNASGEYDVKYYSGRFNAYQRTYVLSLKQDWSYIFFKYQLEDKLLYLQQRSLGGLTKYLTLSILNELTFIIPPNEIQNEFELFVDQIDKSKSVIQKSLDETQLLFDSLMQEYFG